MVAKSSAEETCRVILEEHGGSIANKAKTILLKDPALRNLRAPLEFISEKWRDLTPALMRLSCEAVNGRPNEVNDAAIAMCLMNLSFYLWDDMMDCVRFRSFKPTFFGKFGEGTTLIVGGLSSAKAFSILNKLPIDIARRRLIAKNVWMLWAKMARAETTPLRSQTKNSLKAKFLKIETEAADIETCFRIGAIIGGGSESEIEHLGKCGLCLGIIFELLEDFRISLNLSAELAEKIQNGKLTYSVLWASQRSQSMKKTLQSAKNQPVEPDLIKNIVEKVLSINVQKHLGKKIEGLSMMATNELTSIKPNKANQTLRLFVAAQPKLFAERFQMFRG
jgi:geranylgeranyl diphosphate synthase, type II